jgi:hypothetical protein
MKNIDETRKFENISAFEYGWSVAISHIHAHRGVAFAMMFSAFATLCCGHAADTPHYYPILVAWQLGSLTIRRPSLIGGRFRAPANNVLINNGPMVLALVVVSRTTAQSPPPPQKRACLGNFSILISLENKIAAVAVPPTHSK